MADNLMEVKRVLKSAYLAIVSACYTEDGLDASDGEEVMKDIVKVLGFDPGPKKCGLCKKKFDDCEGH